MPVLVSRFGPKCSVFWALLSVLPVSKFGPGEAFASWQWLNYLVSKVPAGKKALLINMDETAVCLFQGPSKGTVIAGKKRQQQAAPRCSRTQPYFLWSASTAPLLFSKNVHQLSVTPLLCENSPRIASPFWVHLFALLVKVYASIYMTICLTVGRARKVLALQSRELVKQRHEMIFKVPMGLTVTWNNTTASSSLHQLWTPNSFIPVSHFFVQLHIILFKL